MSLGEYLKSKTLSVVLYLFVVTSVFFMGKTFAANDAYIIATVFVISSCYLISFIQEFVAKKKYYDEMFTVLERLDQKYLIAEMDIKGDFIDARILKEILYETDKSMKENINKIEESTEDFKEYLEMWAHEIKLPVAALGLMNHNENTDVKKQKVQIDKIDSYVDQILYYSRAGAAEKDYLLRECNLDKVINSVVKANKTMLIGNRFAIRKNDTDVSVVTDAKWLEFIINQVVANCIKYREESRPSYIDFSVRTLEQSVVLTIEDNGIGICEEDIDRIFEKTFTGANGRIGEKSTGMGLYICQKLLNKMGHKISAESKQGEYTRIIIEFGKNDFYKDAITE